jgi:hypothetical protein
MNTQKPKILYICNDLSDSTLPGFYFSREFNKKCDFRVLVTKRVATPWSAEIPVEKIESSLDKIGIKYSSFGKEIKSLNAVFINQNPDIVVYSNPYDDYREEPLKSFNLENELRYYCFLYATFLAGKNLKQFFKSNIFFAKAQGIFVEKYIREYPYTFTEVSSIKFYRYKSDLQSIEASRSSDRNASGIRVLGWRPRWTIENIELFVTQLDYLSLLISRYPFLNIRVFIHPFLREKLDHSANVEARQAFNSFATLSCVKVIENQDYIPELIDLDLLISEPSTLVWDFLHTGKPYIFLSGDAELSSIGRKVLRYSLGSVLNSKTNRRVHDYLSNGHLRFLDRLKIRFAYRLLPTQPGDPAMSVLGIMETKT